MRFDALTDDQQQQVERLFFDGLFATDPEAFDYETDSAGQVIGRVPLRLRTDAKQHQARQTPISISGVTGQLRPGDSDRLDRALSDLARAVVLSVTNVMEDK